MSVRASSSAWRSTVAGSELLVLLAISDNADDDGLAWPSVETICAKTRLDRRTVQRSINGLEVAKMLRVVYGGGRRSNRYYVTILPDDSRKITVEPSSVKLTQVSPMTPQQRHRTRPSSGTDDAGIVIEPPIEPSFPTGRKRPTLRERFGKDAQEAVASYVEARTQRGLDSPRSDRSILATHFMSMRSKGWTQELCLEAVAVGAPISKSVAFFKEWVYKEFHTQGDKTHGDYTEGILRDGPVAVDTLAAMAEGFRRVS